VTAHLAVAHSSLAWDGRGPIPDLDLPSWAEQPAQRPSVARRPAQLARLANAFPERRLRPFTPGLDAVADPLHNVNGAAAIALHDHGPDAGYINLDWRNPHTGQPVTLTTDPAVEVTGKVAVNTLRDVLHDWRLPKDATTRPVETTRSILEPGTRATMPVWSGAALTQVCGKDGDDLVAGFIDPAAVKGEELTTYAHPYHQPDRRDDRRPTDVRPARLFQHGRLPKAMVHGKVPEGRSTGGRPC
jgi:hypothetical protein